MIQSSDFASLDNTISPTVQSSLTVPPQSIVLQPQMQPASCANPREKYKNVLFNLGITEVILGSLSVILCIATLVIARTKTTYRDYDFDDERSYYWRIRYDLNDLGQGIWCGAAIIAPGVLGIKARKHSSVCMYVANMVVAIVASFFMATLCIISSICAGIVEPKEFAVGYIVLHSIIAVIGFIGMVICIVHSSFCCAGVCCIKKPYQGVVMYTSQPAYSQPQMVQLANGQYMMVSVNVPQNYPALQMPGPSYYNANQMPQQTEGVSLYPPTQPMTKEQEAQLNPPEYTAHSSQNPPLLN
uniref:uncharacterized protein LOC120347536 n=1 Tax=Styela clava TaxID=7725 RepID=UPI00193ADF7A|nr:uncharacterized protein LOC120347536 [Styela clava]